jgi:hypothetical protein
MAAIPLSEMNRAIVKKNPWKGGVYIARQSYPKGATPAHLKAYTERFTAAARECKSAVSGAKGRDKVEALRACIGAKLGK